MEHPFRRPADQSPSTRRREWVHGRLPSGNSNAARGHFLSRSFQPRSRNLLRKIAEIGKSGRESQEVGVIGLRSMKRDDFGGFQSTKVCDFFQVRTKFTAVANGNFHSAWLGEPNRFGALFQFTEPGLYSMVV